MQRTIDLPETPEYVKGIMNLRGKIIPVIDTASLIAEESTSYDDRACIVIVCIHDTLLGLIVEQVDDIVQFEVNELSDPPSFQNGVKKNIVNGIGRKAKGIVLLIDCNRIFREQDLEKLN